MIHEFRRLWIPFRVALGVLALVLIFVGVIAMIAPTPFGFVLVILGVILLAFAAPAFIRRMRKSWPWFDAALTRIARRAPRRLRSLLDKTAPDRCDSN